MRNVCLPRRNKAEGISVVFSTRLQVRDSSIEPDIEDKITLRD
jgi:hypothetical protein